MSRFHAGFSIGTVGSALLGAGLIAIGVPVTAHLTVVAVVVAVAVVAAARAFLPDDSDTAAQPAGHSVGGFGRVGAELAIIGTPGSAPAASPAPAAPAPQQAEAPKAEAPKAEAEYSRAQLDTSQLAYALVNIKNGEAVIKDVLIDGVSIRELVDREE